MEMMAESILARSYGSAAHPDVRRLAPEGAGNLITVDKMRETLGFLASSPASEAMKTLVIYQAHRMNESAANALLKPLEEPTSSTRIVILTDRPGELPVTIRSRCSVYMIGGSDDVACEEITNTLGDEAPKSKAAVVDALALADGNPSLAIQIIRFKLGAWIKKVDTWLDGSDTTPPLPVLTGKTGTPLPDAAMALQALMVRRCRSAIAAGLSAEQAMTSSWSVISRLGDIDRAGIDAKTRLHSILMEAKGAGA